MMKLEDLSDEYDCPGSLESEDEEDVPDAKQADKVQFDVEGEIQEVEEDESDSEEEPESRTHTFVD